MEDATTQSNKGAPSFWDKLPNLIAAGLSVSNASKLLKINRQRAAAGLPPLSPGEYGLAPAATVEVGLSKNTKTLIVAGGLGLAALLSILILRK